METLSNGMTLHIPEGTFPLSTDSMVLAHFVRLPKAASVLDLGSGCGTLGTLLCARDAFCRVTGLELDPVAHSAATENIHRNGLAGRMESICADIAQIPTLFTPGSFDICVSNPPYFSGGPASKIYSDARRDDHCPPELLMKSAAWALRWGGDFFLVHRPENLGILSALGNQNRLELKRLCLLRHTLGGPVGLILMQFRKGAKPGVIWEEICLHDADGAPTADYRSTYHI